MKKQSQFVSNESDNENMLGATGGIPATRGATGGIPATNNQSLSALQTLQEMFPDYDRDILQDILIQCDNDISKASHHLFS